MSGNDNKADSYDGLLDQITVLRNADEEQSIKFLYERLHNLDFTENYLVMSKLLLKQLTTPNLQILPISDVPSIATAFLFKETLSTSADFAKLFYTGYIENYKLLLVSRGDRKINYVIEFVSSCFTKLLQSSHYLDEFEIVEEQKEPLLMYILNLSKYLVNKSLGATELSTEQQEPLPLEADERSTSQSGQSGQAIPGQTQLAPESLSSDKMLQQMKDDEHLQQGTNSEILGLYERLTKDSTGEKLFDTDDCTRIDLIVKTYNRLYAPGGISSTGFQATTEPSQVLVFQR